jgi:bacterioferritin
MSPTRAPVYRPAMTEDDLAFFTDRLRHRYLLFMWRVFREAFFSEILQQEKAMANKPSPSENGRTVNRNDRSATSDDVAPVTREDLVDLLNEDLAREYQAIISYVVYSQVLKGPRYMNIAAELEKHAVEELQHALILAGQIDYLGGMPKVLPKPVKTSEKAEDMLRFDLDNENETIRNYRRRVVQCEALREYAVAEHIRDILVQEQDHQVALANALGVEIPNVTQPDVR